MKTLLKTVRLLQNQEMRTYTLTLLFKNRTKSNKMLVTYIKNKKIYRKMKNKEKKKKINKSDVL